MKALVLGAVATALLVSPAVAGSVCVKNDTNGRIHFIFSVKKPYGGYHTDESPELLPGWDECVRAPDGPDRVQISFETTWNGLPATVKRDCPLPPEGVRQHYRASGSPPNNFSCEMG